MFGRRLSDAESVFQDCRRTPREGTRPTGNGQNPEAL